MPKKPDPDLLGWTKWGEGRMPVATWVLLKYPGQFPKAYLSNWLPRELDTQDLYWKVAPTESLPAEQ